MPEQNSRFHPVQIDLLRPEWAYFFGFAQGDGHLEQGERNRGKLRIELSHIDRHILEAFQQIIPCYSSISTRVRDTNFKNNAESCCLTASDWGFREALFNLGLPYGRKSENVGFPTAPYSERNYFRGWVDADGSVGWAKHGKNEKPVPFLGFGTKSPQIMEAFKAYCRTFVQRSMDVLPNKRDKMYNLTFFKEDAQVLARQLYQPGDLALDRKAKAAQDILGWVRPEGMRKQYRTKPWTHEEDVIVSENTSAAAARILSRTLKSVRIRAWRLGTAGISG